MYSSGSVMYCSTVTCLTAIATILSRSAGELVIAPSNTESMVGDSTYLNCSTDLEHAEIFWYHGSKYIYNGHGILEPYNGRFEIDRNASNGSHNLVIHSVKPADAGKYICSDDDGSGMTRSAQLIVLDKDPECQSNIQPGGVIGQNIFNIPPDEVQLTCNVAFHGNIAPELEWTKSGDVRSLKSNLTSTVREKGRLLYTLNLKGDISLDRTSYVCQTTRSTQYQYNCTTEIIKVLYFVERDTIEQNVVKGDKITCIASNNTFACTSHWYHDNYTCPLSCDETITTQLLGEYLCTVKCHVRGRDYYFEVLKAFVGEEITPQLLPVSVAAVVSMAIVIMALSIAARLTYKYNKRRKYVQESVPQMEENEHLLSMIDYCADPESTDDDVAKEEIELFYKVKKSNDANVKEKRIVAATILRRKLFIARINISTIDVYDFNDKSKSVVKVNPLKVTVNDLVSAYDMCSCVKDNCLYILDNKRMSANEIMKLSTTGTLKNKWRTRENAVGNLSVATNGNVILAAHYKNSLLEYSPDGKLLSEIKLPLDCSNLSHAIKLDNGCFVICHGTLFSSSPRVCSVNIVGNEIKIKKSFPDEQSSEKMQLRWPSYLAVGKNGCIIVSDMFGSRLLLFDSNLNFRKKIVPKYNQGFRGPLMISLDDTSDEKLLAVVITGGGYTPASYMQSTEEDGQASTENDELLRREEAEKTALVVTPRRHIHAVVKKMDEKTKANDADDHKDKIYEDVKKLYVDAKQKYEAAKKKYEDYSKKIEEDAKLIELDEENKIDKDCVLLVFNIEPLLLQ